MSGKTVLQKRLITILLSGAIVLLGVFALISIERLQGNARVINYAGVVRGATQRLVKEELQGHPNDALIKRLDGIISELSTGEGGNGLIRLEDENFQSLMVQMRKAWEIIKQEILVVRQGGDTGKLYTLSEDYFELADRTVTEAELYTERNVQGAELSFAVITAAFVIVSCFIAWLSSVQNKRQKAMQKAAEESRLESEQLTRKTQALQIPMNEISELIYVSDMDTHELLYINEAGKKSFRVDDISGKMCYTVIQGRETPCPFCTNGYLKQDENYNWEITNPVTGRHYMLKDRMIEWEGRKAHLEIAFDMTLVENEKLKLEYALNAEDMVMECIRVLYQARDLDRDILTVLEKVGKFLEGARTYIIRIEDGLFYNDLEWCADGVASQKESIQGVPMSVFGRWVDIFEKQDCMVIENLEDYKDSFPGEYEFLSAQGIESLVIAPMEKDGVLTGCLGIDNPPLDKLGNIGSLLQTLCYFILLAYRRADNEHQLSHMSFHDTLTTFYNRNRFIQDMEDLSCQDIPVGIVYLDVNGLKEVNDKLGHADGDKLLVETAGKIRDIFNPEGCYRVGGDEFIVVDRNVPEAEFEQAVEKLKRSFKWDDRCNAAIGTEWTGCSCNIRQIVADADARMYEDKKEYYRKNRASGRYRHRDDEVLQLADPAVLRSEIGREQFVVYLQPKISASDRKAVGAEALIRYKSGDGSLVLPGNFLPLLEEAKSISVIDFYVFEIICSKIRTWLEAGKEGIRVAVNFSRYSLVLPSFVEHLKDICRTYGISPGYLEIEITESARDVEGIDISNLISSLRREGFGVTVDDFGIEYTNLALLSAIEFDVLKLDKSIIKDVAVNPRAQAIVKSTVDFCRTMGIQLVAEGVEKEEQLSMLRSCGVELIQGYLFSHPIPIEEYEKRYL